MNALCINRTFHGGDEGKWVEAEIVVSLGELIDFDIERLNNYAEEAIMEPDEEVLTNIGYQLVSCNPRNNIINVKVTADIDEW